jgi:hypothetical protein
MPSFVANPNNFFWEHQPKLATGQIKPKLAK